MYQSSKELFNKGCRRVGHIIENNTGAIVGTVGTAITTFSVSAFAAVPAAVTTAIDEGAADGKTIAYALLTMAVAVGVVMWIKRKSG